MRYSLCNLPVPCNDNDPDLPSAEEMEILVSMFAGGRPIW